MSTNILDDYVPEAAFAEANGVGQRTISRYRNEPNGLPYMVWGGKVWIHVPGARDWIASRIRRNNPRRREGGPRKEAI